MDITFKLSSHNSYKFLIINIIVIIYTSPLTQTLYHDQNYYIEKQKHPPTQHE